MGLDRFERVTRNAAEIVTEEELEELLDEKEHPTAYIGFEPSGTAHLGWKVCANKIRDLQDAGFEVTVLLADWHAQINDKLDGDLERIQACAVYMEEAFKALGVAEDTTFTYASEWVDDPDYWAMVLKVAKSTTLNRIKRSMTIMGRQEDDADLDYGKTIYPAMQVADIYYGSFDLAYGGLDQRSAHMLARDVASKLDLEPPVALHTPLVPALTEEGGRMDPVAGKMSKSKPDSGVFLHDSPEEVRDKLKGAYCPQGEVDGNPVLELLKHVVLPDLGELHVDRPEKFGGPLHFESFQEIAKSFGGGELHPLDLKNATAEALIEILDDVRAYFDENPEGMKALETALAEE